MSALTQSTDKVIRTMHSRTHTMHTHTPGPYSDVWHNGPIQGSQRLAKEPGKRDLWTQEAERVRELEWERDRERNRSRTRSPQFSMSQPRGRGSNPYPVGARSPYAGYVFRD